MQVTSLLLSTEEFVLLKKGPVSHEHINNRKVDMVRVCPCRLMEITSLDQVCRGAAAVAVGVSGTAVSGALPPGRRRPRGHSRCPPRWCPAPCTGSPQTPGPPSRRSGSTLRDMKDKRSVSGQDTTRSCASWEFDSWNWTGTLYPISDYDALRRAHTHTHMCYFYFKNHYMSEPYKKSYAPVHLNLIPFSPGEAKCLNGSFRFWCDARTSQWDTFIHVDVSQKRQWC
jgi:hypothetical protein